MTADTLPYSGIESSDTFKSNLAFCANCFDMSFKSLPVNIFGKYITGVFISWNPQYSYCFILF